MMLVKNLGQYCDLVGIETAKIVLQVLKGARLEDWLPFVILGSSSQAGSTPPPDPPVIVYPGPPPNGSKASIYIYRTVIGALVLLIVSMLGNQALYWSGVLTKDNIQFPWYTDKPVFEKRIVDNEQDILRLQIRMDRLREELQTLRIALIQHDRDPGRLQLQDLLPSSPAPRQDRSTLPP